MKTVLFTGCSFSAEEINLLKKNGITIKRERVDLSEQELIKVLQGCKGYVVGGADKATKKVIDSTNLEIIIFHGTGYENYIDVNVATQKGITVANTPKANAYTVAEHTVALILSVVKRITWLNSTTKKGSWNKRRVWNLHAKTLGIIGMGTIGTHVAKVMHAAFDMKTVYVSRTKKEKVEKEFGAKKVSLKELLKSSDVVSIHTPLNKDTTQMIGEKELALMKPDSILVNAARAKLVDGKALAKALRKGIIATAAFDGYYQEPAPSIKDDKWGLLSLPDDKFIITPHTAYNSKEALENMNKMVIENLTAFFSGDKPPYLVNQFKK